MIENIIVAIIIAAAVAIAVRAVYRLSRGEKTQLSPCSSCKLREQCNKCNKAKEENNSKKCCHNFGQSENND